MYDYFQNKSSIQKLIRTEHSCIPQQRGVFNTIITGVTEGGGLLHHQRFCEFLSAEQARERDYFIKWRRRLGWGGVRAKGEGMRK